MCGKRKKTVWEAWRHMPHLDALFNRLSNDPAQMNEEDMNEIERFIVVLYSRTSHLSKVNEARRQLFAHGNRQFENIPPTRAALFQHVKRAAYQGVTFEVRHRSKTHHCLLLQTEVGKKQQKMESGLRHWNLFQRFQKAVVNCWNAAAKNRVLPDANALNQIWSLHSCAFVLASVSRVIKWTECELYITESYLL